MKNTETSDITFLAQHLPSPFSFTFISSTNAQQPHSITCIFLPLCWIKPATPAGFAINFS